jgi:membrane protease YdiL (CAAX protease family)
VAFEHAGETRSAEPTEALAPRRARPTMNKILFLATFLGAWFLLDRLVTSPPNLLSATAALAAATAVLVAGQRATGVALRDIPRSLGLGRPVVRALVVAGIVGASVFLCLLLGARVVGVTLELRENWPSVLLAALIFHGLAEELVWRGFVFGHFRQSTTFWRAVAKSVPLITLTHVPILFMSGVAIGVVAILTASLTCLPFAYLWERGGGTVWAPALLHGLIDSWQLFERTYPDRFSVVILTAVIVVPMSVFLFRDPFFKAPFQVTVRRRLRPSP